MAKSNIPQLATVVVLTIMAQYIITGWVVSYGADTAVVSHVSFAGTIISIILAILAIAYSFVQSLSQKQDAANVSSQIDLLRHVVEDTRSSSVDLTEQLDRLTEIQSKLDTSLSLHQESQTEVKSISSEVTAIRGALDKLASFQHKPAVEPEPTSATIESLPAAATDYQLAVYLELVKVSQADGSEKRSSGERFAEIASASIKENKKAVANLYQGYFIGVTNTLVGLGLVKRMGEAVTVDHDFAQRVVETATKRLAGSATEWSITRGIRDFDG